MRPRCRDSLQAMSVEAMDVISGLVWPGALMTGREAPFPLCMASSCSKWKYFLGEVFCLTLTEFKS